MRGPVAVVALLAVPLLAGCLGGSPAEATLADAELDHDVPDVPANRTTARARLPSGVEADLPVLGPPVDPWPPNTTEVQLLDATVNVDECGGPAGQLLGTALSLAFYQTVGWGCRDPIPLDAGALLLEGTGVLRVEADASGATRFGTWGVYLSSTAQGWRWEWGNRDVEGAPTRDATATWTFPVAPADWDARGAQTSMLQLAVWAYGSPESFLRGPVKLSVVAERDPAWTPAPRLDHFRLPELHAIPRDGVITLLDETTTIVDPGVVSDVTGATDRVTVPPLADRIVAETRQVAVGIAYENVQGCPAVIRCSLRGYVYAPIVSLTEPDAVASWSGERAWVWVFDVPRQLPSDPEGAESSRVSLHLTVTEEVGPVSGDCSCSVEDLRSSTRILVEAWETDVDIDEVRVRLGVA